MHTTRRTNYNTMGDQDKGGDDEGDTRPRGGDPLRNLQKSQLEKLMANPVGFIERLHCHHHWVYDITLCCIS
jgi:hypothetical protein